MTDKTELDWELIHDDKYGELIQVDVIDFNPRKPIIVAIIRKKNVDYLAIHRGWIKNGNELSYGKGIRISLEEEEGELVALAIQGMILQNDYLMEE